MSIVFSGDKKETAFGELVFPVLPGLPKVISDQFVNRAGIVPVRYVKGDTEFMRIDTLGQQVFDFHIQLGGTQEEVESNIAHLRTFFGGALAGLDQEKYTVAQRILYSDNPDYKPRTVPRVLLVRVFKAADFTCSEHPELLAGEPLGMYHCPVCMQMQMAGMPHVSEKDEGDAQGH